jgi:hypothetical protein
MCTVGIGEHGIFGEDVEKGGISKEEIIFAILDKRTHFWY